LRRTARRAASARPATFEDGERGALHREDLVDAARGELAGQGRGLLREHDGGERLLQGVGELAARGDELEGRGSQDPALGDGDDEDSFVGH